MVKLDLFSVPLQPWQSEEEGSWLREYPVTLMQFFRYLYHNVLDLAPMWHSPEFLCALAAAVFPFNIRPYSEMVSARSVASVPPTHPSSVTNLPAAFHGPQQL